MICVVGCAAPAFELTEEAAVDRLMATRHVAGLRRENPGPLICFVEDAGPDAVDLYLGEDHPTHTVRVGSYRVTSDGRVWVNSDATLLEDRWVPVQ